jgi:hypothetical protein
MKRTPVAELPLRVVADIAEYSVMSGIPFKIVLDIYYGCDVISVMGWFLIKCGIHSNNHLHVVNKLDGLNFVPGRYTGLGGTA